VSGVTDPAVGALTGADGGSGGGLLGAATGTVDHVANAATGTVSGATDTAVGTLGASGDGVQSAAVRVVSGAANTVTDTAHTAVGAISGSSVGTPGGSGPVDGLTGAVTGTGSSGVDTVGTALGASGHEATSTATAAHAAGSVGTPIVAHGTAPVFDGAAAPTPDAAHAGTVSAIPGHSIEDVLNGIATNLASHPGTIPFLVAAAAGTAGAGYMITRCFTPVMALSGGPLPLLFNSVRLLPCTAVQTVGGTISTVEGTAGRIGVIARDEIGQLKDGFNEARNRAERAAEQLRHAVSGGEGAADNRLLMQLALVLGFGYIAFLTLWFWATRTRFGRA
jgi:hypothetical protein